MWLSKINTATIIIGLVSVLGSTTLVGQTRISGVVHDETTGEGLPFANVQIKGQLLTTADISGYFSLSDMLSDSIEISYVGYKTKAYSVESLSKTLVNSIALSTEAELPTIEVTIPTSVFGPTASILTPSVSELVRVPALAGEVDILKSLTLLPGVSGGTEGSAALNIRGGNPNQTDLLVDGNRVYNVNHIGGFLSAIPAFGTKAVTVYKGGVPAQYGGRLSGVVDITLREGRRDQHAQTYTIGLGTLQAGIEGPSGQKGSFLVNGRYSYPSIIYNLANGGNYKRYEYGSHQSISLYDFVGTYRLRFNKHTLYASAFLSGDQGFDQYSNTGEGVASDEFSWGNRSLSLNHQYRTDVGGVWTNSIQVLNYQYEFDNRDIPRRREDIATTTSQRILSNQLNDIVLKTGFSQSINQIVDLTAGLQIVNHSFNAKVADTYTTGEDVLKYDRRIGQDSVEVAAYVSADWRFVKDRLHLMTGLRVTGQGAVKPRNFEPRIRISYNVFKRLYLNGSYDRHYQYIHQLTPEIAIYPNELYLLASDRFPVEQSDQLALGVGGLEGSFQWSIEVFRKRFADLVRLQPGQERDNDFIVRFPDNVIGDGKGRVKGLELFVKAENQKFSYSAAYTLSKSERRYNQVNQGQWFPFTFDRRHDISLTASKDIGRDWNLNTSFVYQTGYSFTAPVATTAFYNIYGRYNGAKLSPFHVLNISGTKAWAGKKRPNRYHSLTFSVYNLYNRANAYTVELYSASRTVTDPITGIENEVAYLRTVTRSLLPIIPGVNYTVTLR